MNSYTPVTPCRLCPSRPLNISWVLVQIVLQYLHGLWEFRTSSSIEFTRRIPCAMSKCFNRGQHTQIPIGREDDSHRRERKVSRACGYYTPGESTLAKQRAGEDRAGSSRTTPKWYGSSERKHGGSLATVTDNVNDDLSCWPLAEAANHSICSHRFVDPIRYIVLPLLEFIRCGRDAGCVGCMECLFGKFPSTLYWQMQF